MLFAVRWINFFPDEHQNHKLPICEVCWPVLREKYTCAINQGCEWPAPLRSIGTRHDIYCAECRSLARCEHGWHDLVAVCEEHKDKIEDVIKLVDHGIK